MINITDAISGERIIRACPFSYSPEYVLILRWKLEVPAFVYLQAIWTTKLYCTSTVLSNILLTTHLRNLLS